MSTLVAALTAPGRAMSTLVAAPTAPGLTMGALAETERLVARTDATRSRLSVAEAAFGRTSGGVQ